MKPCSLVLFSPAWENKMIPLSEKYRPSKFEEIIGQDIAITKIKAFCNAFNKGLSQKNALLLYGPAGTGKTTLAMVLAKEMSYELFELNASDLRNRLKLDEVLKPSTLQGSLFAKGKIILVDEVDGVTSTEYGGLTELIALIEKTKFPIIITANDIWQNKFALLRKKCELVQLKDIPYREVVDFLIKIIAKENKKVDEELIKGIAIKTKGDLRAAVNDIQSIINAEAGAVTNENIGEREKAEDIFNILKKIFKVKTTKETMGIYDNVDMEMDQIVLWLEKNIPKEYRGEDLVKAFEALSKADVFKGRIYKQQHWRFLVYQNFFLSTGISSAKKEKTGFGFTKYERPTRILKIWMANQKNAKKKSIAVKYAEYAHISKKRALQEFFNIALILDDNLARKLALSEQEKEFIIDYRGALKIAHGLNRFVI